jgi:phenylalanyl-tRNA synthetase beta chain
MRVPLSWLREFTDCSLPEDEIAQRLTLSGIEVEGIERIGVFSDDVFVASVLSVRDLPRSRELRLVEVDLGGGRCELAVTGAPNVRPGRDGLRVAAALPGARLIDPKAEGFALLEVEAKEVLGVRSSTVLCSAKELGLSPDHSGVLELDSALPLGARVRDHVKAPPDAEADVVLEIAVLPNYGRCLSVVGVAREVAALTRCSFRLRLAVRPLPLDPQSFPVEIRDPDLCRRYSALVLDGLEVRPSPRWLGRRLVLAGLKPINNLVDVTNYVMFEMGQPMHAFDLDRLPAPNIAVRRARPGETMFTLDQDPSSDGASPRKLDESMVLITSGDQPVAIGGIIGGLGSEIRPETKSVLLESANFDPIAIRKGMGKLGLVTDSALRFSRDVDPALTVAAIYRAAHLYQELAGAEPRGGIADALPSAISSRVIEVTCRDICRTLGAHFEVDEIRSALDRLGFQVGVADHETLEVTVPGFRPDVTIPADIAEEVIRVAGFERLEPRRLTEALPEQERNVAIETRERLRDALVGWGLQDVLNYTLTTPEAEARLAAAEIPDWKSAPERPYVKVLNPTSQERSHLRRTLLGGLIENVARNRRRRERIALFEIGLVFLPEAGDGVLPREALRLGIVLSGPLREPTWIEPSPRPAGFFDLKGIVEGSLRLFHIGNPTFVACTRTPFHPGAAAELRLGEEACGSFGQIHPAVQEAFDLDDRVVFAAELDLDALLKAARPYDAYRPFSRFPPVRQDLALVVDEGISTQQVEAAIRRHAGQLLESVRLFDLYRGQQLEAGKKSLAFALTFSATDRSLTEEEVNGIRDAMLGPLAAELGARIR